MKYFLLKKFSQNEISNEMQKTLTKLIDSLKEKSLIFLGMNAIFEPSKRTVVMSVGKRVEQESLHAFHAEIVFSFKKEKLITIS